MLVQIVTSLHIFICLLLIVLVLLQQGKGADAGVTFGGGGNTVFGAAGADNFITRFTTVLACCFMLTSVFLGVQSKPASPAEGRLFKGVADSAPVAAPEPAKTEETKATAETQTEPVANANQTSAANTTETSEQPQQNETKAAPESAASSSESNSSEAAIPVQ